MKPATAGAPYTVPPEPSRLPAFLLAVAVHAVLLGFLWFGISWQNTEPVAVEAEVWDMSIQTAAAPPPPAPVREPEPEPEPAPPPRLVEPPPVERPAPTPPPDIKLQREKERKEQEKRELAEQKERELEQKRKEDQRKQELADKKKKEDAEREKKELAKKEADEKKKADKLAADKAAKEKAAKEKAEAAKLAKLAQDELKRIAGAMGTAGTAEKSTGPRSDDAYAAALNAAIKSNTAYGGSTTMPGNPRVVFKVEQLPTGEVMSVRLVKSSGVPEFDRAVENGIRKASPLPKRKDGTVDRTAEIGFKLKDLE